MTLSVVIWFLVWLLLVGTALFVAVSYLLAFWVFPGGGSHGPHDTMASRAVGLILVIAIEMLATLWVILVIPLRRVRLSPAIPALPQGRHPVAILPGFLENPLTMTWLKKRLERQLLVPVRVLRPPRYFGGLERLAGSYQQQLLEFLEATGAAQVDLVGHSIGGLLGRHLAQGEALKGKIRAVVSVGTPHLGTAIAGWLPGRIMRQIQRGSAFLETLNATPAPAQVRFIGISSSHDNLVLPWNFALSPWGDNFIIRFQGHLTLILSGEVARLVARELRA
jgi:pimeloyl-ACP methyl ester carboxylesterase